jgi:ComF family protein
MVPSVMLQPLRDFLFITDCFHCGEQLRDGERRICRRCWDSVTPVRETDHTFSVLTQRFAAGGVIDGVTAFCYFEKGKLLQTLAHSLKYEEFTSFGYELGVKLAGTLPRRSFDAIIPIPLNKRKERERGYNQSDWIGKGISSVTGIPLLPKVIRRVKYTVTQTHLTADQRKENIAEAFQASDAGWIKDKSVLLVDDIITTGSTIQEAIHVGAAGLALLGEG